MSNNNVRLRCEKKGDPEWQLKETSPKKQAYPIGSRGKEMHSNERVSPLRKLSVTDFIAFINTTVISNELKQPVTDRALIGNGLYELVTDRFNFYNGLNLKSVTTNSCNGRLRGPLPEVHIGNGRSGGKPRGRPAALMGNRRQKTTVKDVGVRNRC
jgi:hypothetical protein